MNIKYTIKLKYSNKTVIKDIKVKDCLDYTHGKKRLSIHLIAKHRLLKGFEVIEHSKY